MKPGFDCERARLRDLCVGDAKEVYDILSNRDVTRYYDMPPLRTESEAAGLIERWQRAEDADVALRWAIVCNVSSRVIGTAGLHALDWRHARGELGFDLHPDWWGKGIMRDVLPKVIDYAFDELNLGRIGAVVVPHNTPSIRLLSKLGFTVEGTLQSFLRIGSDSQDAVCLGLTNKRRSGVEMEKLEVVEI